jgi:hypothetical protein
MSFAFADLDPETRRLMLVEIDEDISANKLYLSDRLSAFGRDAYPQLLREAALFFDEHWLAEKLRARNCFNATYSRRNSKGGLTEVRMPVNAADMLAEGEFNRFYIRALCRRAIKDGIAELIVYRGKPVTSPRPESEAKIGQLVSPQALLADLRENIGVDTSLGLPAGPSSGLTVRLAQAITLASRDVA